MHILAHLGEGAWATICTLMRRSHTHDCSYHRLRGVRGLFVSQVFTDALDWEKLHSGQLILDMQPVCLVQELQQLIHLMVGWWLFATHSPLRNPLATPSRASVLQGLYLRWLAQQRRQRL